MVNRLIAILLLCSTAQAQCPPEVSKPDVLIVWCAGWCGPCRKFWEHYNSTYERSFRAELNRRYTSVVHVDVDRWPACAKAHGVTAVPTFDYSDRRVIGYDFVKHPDVRRWLLDTLPDPTRKPQPPPRQQSPEKGFLPDLPDAPEPPKQSVHPVKPPEPATQGDASISISPPVEQSVAVPSNNEQPGVTESNDEQPTQPVVVNHVQPASRKPWLDLLSFGADVAPWVIGVSGIATGGVGTAALFGLKAWMKLRKLSRREPQIAATHSPSATGQVCPPTQQVVRGETAYIPYETDSFYKAYVWANDQLVRHSPGVVDTIEAQKAKIDQHLSGQAVKRS